MNKTRKLSIITIFILASTSASAALRDSFVKINNFFLNREYSTFALIIDFTAFFIFFFAVFNMALKKALQSEKEHKAIALILALSFSIAMVKMGATILFFLDYVQIVLLVIFTAAIFKLFYRQDQSTKKKVALFVISLVISAIILIMFGWFVSGSETSLSDGFFNFLNNIGLGEV